MTFTWTRTLLRCTACGASWETPKDEPHECAVMAARSQADALAEALDYLIARCEREFAEGQPPELDFVMLAVQEVKPRLASYRSSSSTETEG